MAKKDETGNVYSFLTVVRESGSNKSGQIRWLCLCRCGKETNVEGTSLRLGRVKSCGCQSPKFNSEKVKTHGLSRTRTYKIWAGMKRRCISPTSEKNHLYYSKGIKVCERWQKFENFYAVGVMVVVTDGVGVLLDVMLGVIVLVGVILGVTVIVGVS